MAHAIGRAAKRIFDLAASLVGILLCLPILVLVALVIKLDSPGPILYRQGRVGLGGASFTLYKFRTMVTGADRSSRLTTSRDARITRVGGFLRRTNLDELPQLLNVLLGDMSLVGPRPEVPEFVDMDDPLWRKTLSVRPGMTAPITVEFRREGTILATYADPARGYREDILPKKLRANAAYVDTWSFWKDVKTIFATFVDILSPAPPEVREGSGGRLLLGRIKVTPARRFAFFVTIDACLIALSTVAAAALRFDGSIPAADARDVAVTATANTGLIISALFLTGIYRVSWSFVSLRDVVRIGAAILATSVGLFMGATIYGLFGTVTIPRSVIIIQVPLTFCALAAFRLMKRAWLARSGSVGPRDGSPTLIVGAGKVGEQILKSMLDGGRPKHRVVGFLDDDALAWGTLIQGVEVLGPVATLEDIVRARNVETVILSKPGASGALVRDVVRASRAAGAKNIRIVPPLRDMVDGQVTAEKTREVRLEDLLGRETVRIGTEAVAGLLSGKHVLVTGGAGTIGSELCRQIARFGPARLTVLDVDESRLHDTVVDLQAAHAGVEVHEALCDVRDVRSLEEHFARERPHIVFHAAAYKHVPMMEKYPLAALDVNVLGTANVLDAAEGSGCSRFVLISTDKAVEPSSIMGASKRLAEAVVAGTPRSAGMICSAVRFGNVIGSRGSVIPIFERQLKNGGPLTVTHPDMERFFMVTSEAVSLVLQAAALGRGSDLFVLDMGKPVRILDVAREFIRLSGAEPDVDIAIEFTGLRPGEKLVEALTYAHERTQRTEHERVMRAKLEITDLPAGVLDEARILVQRRDSAGALSLLRRTFPSLPGALPPRAPEAGTRLPVK